MPCVIRSYDFYLISNMSNWKRSDLVYCIFFLVILFFAQSISSLRCHCSLYKSCLLSRSRLCEKYFLRVLSPGRHASLFCTQGRIGFPDTPARRVAENNNGVISRARLILCPSHSSIFSSSLQPCSSLLSLPRLLSMRSPRTCISLDYLQMNY